MISHISAWSNGIASSLDVLRQTEYYNVKVTNKQEKAYCSMIRLFLLQGAFDVGFLRISHIFSVLAWSNDIAPP
jgi:hypothetical protein